uniref:NSF attachment protein alpha n=1 Tax=Equus asinus asinus TaxID=83772 RepID=A0A8C4PHM8_EQUAS
MDNSGKEAEAMALLAEAERKVKNSQSFFSGLFGGSSKVEEACEIYARAANMFKMAKNWSAAGNAFCQAAQLHLQLQSKHDAATCFVDAGNAFKKADPQEAINCLMRAIEIYTDMGRFTIAAKHHISIAEIYETELVDIEKAIAHYEQSADYYKGEESNSSANKCLLKVAGYAAQLEQYQKAIDIYEQVGTGWGLVSHSAPLPPSLSLHFPLSSRPRPLLSLSRHFLQPQPHLVPPPSPWTCPSHAPHRARPAWPPSEAN